MAASLTCICRIDKLDGDTKSSGFIGNKLLQLVKTPSCHHAVKMLIPRLCPVANILKLLHADQSAIVPFSFLDKRFGKNMVFMSDFPVFVSGNFLENFFCTLFTFGLQACANFSSLFLKFLSGFSFYINPVDVVAILSSPRSMPITPSPPREAGTNS